MFSYFSQCNGSSIHHDQHDAIFGGRRIYLICLGTWVVSFLTLMPDIMGVIVIIINPRAKRVVAMLVGRPHNKKSCSYNFYFVLAGRPNNKKSYLAPTRLALFII